jgi:thioredoxin reductase
VETPIHDVVVVGGGAAGLSAALVLGRARRRVAVIDAGAPRNARAAHMQGYLSRDGMSPADLLAAGRAEVSAYGVELVEDQVVGIDAGFVIRLAGGRELTARRILVATGVRDELPEIPGVSERWGRVYCTARTATGGRSATSRSAFSEPSPAQSSTPNWCGSGPTT